jgi:hypothetical protein
MPVPLTPEEREARRAELRRVVAASKAENAGLRAGLTEEKAARVAVEEVARVRRERLKDAGLIADEMPPSRRAQTICRGTWHFLPRTRSSPP